MVEGSCFCGTLRYAAEGPFGTMMNCHCSMCRKHHGAAFATYVSTHIDRFHWSRGEEALLSYASSAQGLRNSCRVCGSAVPITLPAQALALLPAGPLEGSLGVRPQAHMFVASRAPWYSITDDLPQHAEFPPALGMSGVDRPKIESRAGLTQGSCLCAAVAYEASGQPFRMQNCHCLRCRRARGAAHASNVFYRPAQFRWSRGAELVSEYKLPEARFYTTAFCRRCGGALPRVSADRDIVVIPAGSLDTDPPLRPERHIFTHYKADWFDITDPLPQFTEGPPS